MLINKITSQMFQGHTSPLTSRTLLIFLFKGWQWYSVSSFDLHDTLMSV